MFREIPDKFIRDPQTYDRIDPCPDSLCKSSVYIIIHLKQPDGITVILSFLSVSADDRKGEIFEFRNDPDRITASFYEGQDQIVFYISQFFFKLSII